MSVIRSALPRPRDTTPGLAHRQGSRSVSAQTPPAGTPASAKRLDPPLVLQIAQNPIDVAVTHPGGSAATVLGGSAPKWRTRSRKPPIQ
jgi:hypothetical protein